MTQTTKRVLKTVLVVLLASAGGLFVFDYLEVHPFGPAVRYQLETKAGRTIALLHLGEPDAGYVFNGNDGYVYEVKPVQIGEGGAVLDIRIRRLDHIIEFGAVREELKNTEPHRFSLRSGQSISVPIEGGTSAVLTSLPI